jgi:hypothetical protein
MKRKIYVVFMIVLLVLLSSCGKNKAAPLDVELFSKITASMEQIIATKDHYTPSAKAAKVVMEEAFKRNGFSYSATLHKVATEGFLLQDHQLVGMLLLPALNPAEDYKHVYEGQELQDVETIFKILNQ